MVNEYNMENEDDVLVNASYKGEPFNVQLYRQFGTGLTVVACSNNTPALIRRAAAKFHRAACLTPGLAAGMLRRDIERYKGYRFDGFRFGRKQ